MDIKRFFDTVDAISRNEQQHNPQLEEVRHFYHSPEAARRLESYQKYNIKKAYKIFLKNIKPQPRISYRSRALWAAAAAAAVAIVMVWPRLSGNKPSDEVITMLNRSIPALTDSVPTITTNSGKTIKLDHATDDLDVGGTSAYVTESGLAMNNSDTKEELLELNVPYGRQYQIALPDGTAIILNSGSKLKFPSRMDTNRKVYLEGEAYFDVKKNGQTFVVSTGAGIVTVMGTTFNIKSYDARHAGVALYSGKVSFRSGDRDYLLRPGEEAIKDGDQVTVQPIGTGRSASWRDGLIVFKDQRLETIMHEIERIYGVEVEFRADVRDIRFSGECRRTQSVEDFLKTMSMTDEFNYEINGKRVIIQ